MGRWGGTRFNPQNLPRGVSIDVDAAIDLALRRDLTGMRRVADAAGIGVADLLGTLVRPCVRAQVGHLFAVVDYSSVEARALLWLASRSREGGGFEVADDVAGDAFGSRELPCVAGRSGLSWACASSLASSAGGGGQ